MKLTLDLRDYIVSFDDMMHPNTCDEIVARYLESDKWEEATTNGSSQDNVRSKSRVCYTIPVSKYPSEKNIDHTLYTVFSKSISKYSERFPFFNVRNDEGYFLLKYLEGGKYSQHVDAGIDYHRTCSVILALNDGYTGGELKFFDGQHTQELKKGSVVVFPSSYTYPHQVTPVTSGERYSVVSWFN